ncbi:glucans biosynthesis glucosyltransferase MdoH [Halioxenophilus aromaticivorans]
MFGRQKASSNRQYLDSTGSGRGAPGGAHYPLKSLRLPVFLIVALSTTVAGGWMMHDILSANGLTIFETTLLVFFVATFSWISVAFWSGFLGFVLQLSNRDPLTLTAQHGIAKSSQLDEFRTAVIMPVYNEDVDRVIAGFETSFRSMVATGNIDHFDFYLLSDSQSEAIKAQELRAWRHLQARLGHLADHIYYRNRTDNKNRKVGNIEEFCQRWGWRYEAMIVLDADSVMTGSCMVDLASRMKANPKLGLLQTVPIPVRQTTTFGRFLQFAASLCSPMLATGLAFWQTDNANYWGHNAIIRVQAFVTSCGLPVLPGKAPFGGEILSHDFVEAALLRRSGWQVLLDAKQGGSFEEVPGNILDYATRDRRWLQGNIQHLGLLGAAKLTLMSRLHMLLGAMAYLTSVLWFVMLLLSSLDAVSRAVAPKEFFSAGYQLFPSWPIAKTGVIISLLVVTACLLLLPKMFSLILACRDNAKSYGGVVRLSASAVFEFFFAVIIAPIMMVFHTCFVFSTLSGVNITWNAQPREGRTLSWGETFRRTWWVSLLALAWAGVTAYYTTTYFYWLLPVVTGLILAAPIIRWSSSPRVGLWLRKHRFLLSPSEACHCIELEELDHSLEQVRYDLSKPALDESINPELLPDVYLAMPKQSLFKYQKPKPAYKPTGTQPIVR